MLSTNVSHKVLEHQVEQLLIPASYTERYRRNVYCKNLKTFHLREAIFKKSFVVQAVDKHHNLFRSKLLFWLCLEAVFAI